MNLMYLNCAKIRVLKTDNSLLIEIYHGPQVTDIHHDVAGFELQEWGMQLECWLNAEILLAAGYITIKSPRIPRTSHLILCVYIFRNSRIQQSAGFLWRCRIFLFLFFEVARNESDGNVAWETFPDAFQIIPDETIWSLCMHT